jgi:pimeloyl-ACP methyl ester carboxylesterase
MATFTVPGPKSQPQLRLAFDVMGEGPAIVLVHGFASSRVINWRAPGWYHTLAEAGRQVIALDVRGHGQSDKPHDAAAYDEGELARDVVRLLDHLKIERADVMGYSMGGFITLRLLRDNPERVRRAILGGVGDNYYARGTIEFEAIAAALRAPDRESIEGMVPLQFRLFAEQGGNDLEALAMCMTRQRRSIPPQEWRMLKVPVLIVVGEKDTVTGPAGTLAAALPGARIVTVANRDHMTTVGDKAYKAAALDFLREV